MDRVARERLTWKCRRGLLELDIVLERFLRRHASQLSDGQLAQLDELLERPDNEVWDIVAGRDDHFDERYSDIVEQLRAC